MAGKKGKNTGGKKERGLSRREAELWREMTKDVERLPEREYEEGEFEEMFEPAVPLKKEIPEVPKPSRQKTPGAKSHEVDLRTAQKFTRGQMAIEGKIDLHGLGQVEAEEALKRFIKSSYERGKRCVLVVTGKGALDKPGVLKKKTPAWLREGALGEIVLKTSPARPQHGGEGALYVLLRRKRDQ